MISHRRQRKGVRGKPPQLIMTLRDLRMVQRGCGYTELGDNTAARALCGLGNAPPLADLVMG